MIEMRRKQINLVDLVWKLPYGRRTAVRLVSKIKPLDKRVVINLQNVYMEIDVTQTLDMEYAYGQFDADELTFLESHYESGDWFLDIGANMGFYSLFLAKRHPEMKTLAFEPDPYNIEKFKKNITLNGIKNIILCEYALSDENTQKDLMMNTGNNRGGNSFVINQTEFCGEDSRLTVACKTLLDALTENNIHRVGIAKLDVEGFEYPILKSFFSQAPKSIYPRAMVVEAFGENINRVGGSPIELLIKNDYKLVHHSFFNYFFILKR
jgi:FkbM family methyltransferase